ncbi:hypothetical protein OKHIL_27950 [Mycolicibacterium mageritense]
MKISTKIALIAAGGAIIFGALTVVSSDMVSDPCTALAAKRDATYSAYTENNSRLKAMERAGSITVKQRFKMDGESAQKKAWMAAMRDADRCAGEYKSKKNAVATVFAVPAALAGVVAILAGFWAAVSAMTSPMDRALSPTVAAAADGAARQAAAARQAHAARADRRQQQGYGGGYTANYGAGAGGGYIDAEVVDFPMDEGEDWLNADPEPQPEPTTDDRPRSGWGRSVNFGD